MTLKDEILTELRNGMPLAEIQRKFRSKSQLYEALTEYLEEVDQIAEEKRDRLAKIQLALTGAKSELDRVDSEKEDVSAEVQELVEAKKTINDEVESKSKNLAVLKADIKELQSRGFTPEILSEIKAILDRSGPELLLQIKVMEKYKQFAKEISGFKTKKSRLKREINKLETERRRLKGQLVSEKNTLDELKKRAIAFKDAVAVVESLFNDGYSSDDIESLGHGLDMLGIKGDPFVSITRLLEGLSKQKSLVSLNENLIAAKEELASLQNELAVTQGKLNATKQVTLKAVEEVKGTAVAAIAGVAADVDTAIADAAAKFDQRLVSCLGDVEVYVRKIMAGVISELKEWSEIQQQKGELGKLLRPGLAFLGILESPEALKKVELPLVVQLFERLHLWSEMNLQNTSIRPSEDIREKEYNLFTLSTYNVPALIKFVHDGLKQIMIQQRLKAHVEGKTSCQA